MSDPRKIVCFGDSVTYGQGLKSLQNAFPWLLMDMLPDAEIIPRGVPGETTRQALERFPRFVQDVRPSHVIIQFGHNDCNHWDTDHGLPRVSSAAFKANVAEMISRAERFDILPIILAPHPTLKGEVYEGRRAYYASLLHDLAYPVVHAFLKPGGLLLDDIHPNEAGHKEIATALYAHL